MKKRFMPLLSVILALSIIVSGFSAVGASAAKDLGSSLKHVGVAALEGIVRGLLGGLDFMIPDSKNFKKSRKNESNTNKNSNPTISFHIPSDIIKNYM